MSIRAYKVNYLGNRTQQSNEKPSFNCYQEQKVFKRLIDDTGAIEQLGDGCTGFCDVPIKAIVKLLNDKRLKLHPETRKQLKKDIKGIEDCLEDVVTYDLG